MRRIAAVAGALALGCQSVTGPQAPVVTRTTDCRGRPDVDSDVMALERAAELARPPAPGFPPELRDLLDRGRERLQKKDHAYAWASDLVDSLGEAAWRERVREELGVLAKYADTQHPPSWEEYTSTVRVNVPAISEIRIRLVRDEQGGAWRRSGFASPGRPLARFAVPRFAPGDYSLWASQHWYYADDAEDAMALAEKEMMRRVRAKAGREE